MLRRSIALLLMLCLAFYSAEALVADVHDGDATAAELERDAGLHGRRHAGQPDASGSSESEASAQRASGEAPTDASDTSAHVRLSGASGGHESAPQPLQPTHSQHACHCIHAHGFVEASLPRADASELLQPDAPTTHLVRMPPSVGREPQLRPPIAS
jgi:hypothetical protein